MVSTDMLRYDSSIVSRYIQIVNKRDHRGPSRTEIGVMLGMNWEALDRTLDTLEEQGRLAYDYDGRSTFYFLKGGEE